MEIFAEQHKESEFWLYGTFHLDSSEMLVYSWFKDIKYNQEIFV